VIASTVAGRRWDIGILVPEIDYTAGEVDEDGAEAPGPIYRLIELHMTGPIVKEIQRKLKEKGFNPGPLDGDFGSMTHAAVVSFQAARGLLIDGEVGATTARALGVTLE